MPSKGASTRDPASQSSEVRKLESEVAELRLRLAKAEALGRLYDPSDSHHTNSDPLYEEAQHRALLELSPQVVWISDGEGNNTYCNRYWCQFTGLTTQESAGRGWTVAIHDNDLLRLEQTWLRSVTQGVPFEEEVRIRQDMDGQYRWHLMRGVPLRDGEGKASQWMGIAIDINDRKVAITAVAQANERTRLAIEAADIGTWDLYPDTGLIECSQRTLEIFQSLSVKPMREDFLAAVHRDDRERVSQAFRRAINPEIAGPYDIEYRIVQPEGRVRWVHAKGKGFFRGEGTARVATRFSGMIIDITERRAAERDRASLAAALQHSPDCVGITDLQGRVLFLNRAGRELVGLRNDEEARSKTALDFLAAPEREIVQHEMLPTVLAGKVWEREFTMRHFITGEPILVETRVFGIFDEHKRLTRMVNVSRDISEKRKLDERMHMAQKMEAVGRLAGGLAHDFNNLLTIIRGATEMLLERIGDTREGATLKDISEAAERASILTHELLGFGRQDVVRPRAISLNRVVVAIQGILQRLAGEDIRLRIQLEEDLPNVKMDPAQIDQILINLVANARDAMPHGGEIRITTSNQQPLAGPETHGVQYACLSFSDNGQGIAPAELSHIFEPFFNTKREGKNSGLELATVYGIVQHANGHIDVRSARGQGTAFTIYLPGTDEEPEVEPPAPDISAATGTGTILVVEDEPSLRAILAAYLREHGYQVHEASDAKEAVSLAEQHFIDVLLTDIVMPGVSGPALASELSSSQPEIKVIFMSGYADHVALQSAMGHKDALFMHKPFRFSELMPRISQALAARSQKRGKLRNTTNSKQ